MNTALLAAQFTNYCVTYMAFNMVNDFASQMIAINTFKDTEKEYKNTLNTKVFGENNGPNQNKRTH